MENNSIYCPNCGAPITPGTQFCSHCGTPLAQPAPGQVPFIAPAQENAPAGFDWGWGKGLHGILSIAFPIGFAFFFTAMISGSAGGEFGIGEKLVSMFMFLFVGVFFYGFTRLPQLIAFIRSNKTTNAISGFIGGIVKFLTLLYTLIAGLPILGLIIGLSLGLWVVIMAGPVFWVLDIIGFIRIRLNSKRTAA